MILEQTYRAPHYPGRIIFLLHGEVPENFSPDPESGWGGFKADEFEVHVVLRKRMDMLKEPFVAKLAEILNDCVDRTRASQSLTGERQRIMRFSEQR